MSIQFSHAIEQYKHCPQENITLMLSLVFQGLELADNHVLCFLNVDH